MSKANELLYFETVALWKNLCELHRELYEATCDEYQLLLESRIEELGPVIENKQKIISVISVEEERRKRLIEEFALSTNLEIKSISDLLSCVEPFEIVENRRHLFRFNKLLIDIIEKIQEQNKKNKLFINKAFTALDELKLKNFGRKNYSTYNAKGVASPTKGNASF